MNDDLKDYQRSTLNYRFNVFTDSELGKTKVDYVQTWEFNPYTFSIHLRPRGMAEAFLWLDNRYITIAFGEMDACRFAVWNIANKLFQAREDVRLGRIVMPGVSAYKRKLPDE